MAIIYQGAVAPEAFVLNLTPGTSGVDLSTVTAAQIKVKRPDGSFLTWTATRSLQTTTTLTLTYVLTTPDTTLLGKHVAYAILTVPGGTVRSVPLAFTVADQYAA